MSAGSRTGSAGAPTWPNGSGARFARTTPPAATCWDYFPHDHARSRAYRWGEDGLLGIMRPAGPAVLRPGPVERARPHPEGAALRPDRPGRKPRRGRQGGVLLPRVHADPFLHEGPLQIPPAPNSRTTGWCRRTGPAARPSPSSSWPTRACSMTVATSMSSPNTRRPARTTSPSASRWPTGAPSRPRSTCCPRSGSATPGAGAARARATPTGRAPSRRRRAIVAEHSVLGEYELRAEGLSQLAAPALLFTENETNAEPAVRRAECPAAREGRASTAR